jgi:ABC-type uncharacterized transport system involved in gliding motility auxiliary subunit
MKLGRRHMLRAQSLALVLALLIVAGLLAWASVIWHDSADWTYAHRASLGEQTRRVLATLEKPVTISAFARRGSHIGQVEAQLLKRYQRVSPDIRVRFVNPDTALAQVRKLGITTEGELYVSYGKHGMKLDNISEAGVTNALLKLSRGTGKRIVFLTGHGEANPQGQRNFDYGQFGAALKRQGFKVSQLNLADTPLDDTIALVVIAGPQLDLASGEVKELQGWLQQGGNLLWLRNPGKPHGLEPLAHALGVKALQGTIASTASRGFGVDNPTALIIAHYGKSPVTRGLNANTLFPDTTGFAIEKGGDWTSKIFIQSRKFPTSWLMRGGPQDGRVLYRPAVDKPGPIPIAISLTRHHGKQRAAVIGNTSFLSNSYLGNGGNLQLGIKLVNWLAGEDRFIDITPPRAPDQSLTLSAPEQGGIAFGFLAFLPGVFLLIAIALAWLSRRR